jgi:hypothetical protein
MLHKSGRKNAIGGGPNSGSKTFFAGLIALFVWKAFFFSSLVFLLLLPACGKKEWPEPQAAEDTFRWERASAGLISSCLRIRANLAGNTDKLAALFVEVDEGDCPRCPFRPTRRIEIPVSEALTDRPEGNIALALCDPRFGSRVRWRLVGRNIHPSLGERMSRSYLTSAAQ